jgi:hypothetical protein
MGAPQLGQGQFGHGCPAGTRQERRVGIPAYHSDAGIKKGRHVILSALRPKLPKSKIELKSKHEVPGILTAGDVAERGR